MRSFRVASVLLALLLAGASEPGAQITINENVRTSVPDGFQMPGRPQFKSGTGRIRGRVVSADAGGPIRRAQVRLSSPEAGVKTALTGGDGAYEFAELPAGRYTLNATKSGFVTVQYGQTRPFESGKAIDLADGQVMERAEIGMPRGSVISGRLADEFGDPVPDAVITALRSTWSNGKRRLTATGRTSMTNDLGQYRLFGLPPGEYYISANLTGSQMMQVEAAMSVMMATSTAGSGGSMPASGYAPTYFPGTTTGAQAQRITLNPGQEAQSTDFALVPVRLAKVTGTVMSSEGRPVEGTTVNLIPRNPDLAGPLFFGSGGRTDKNGNFSITSVAPGDYTLQTRGAQVIQAGENRMVFTMTSGGPGGASAAEVGSIPVTVAGEDVANVVLVTAKGGTATGRIEYDGGARPENPGNLRVLASPVDTDAPTMMAGGSGAVKPDGSFELSGLAGGRMIRVANVPAGWTLKAVTLNGQDITNRGADFKAGEAVSGLEVVLTNKLTQVTGRVENNSGEPMKDYTVVVFSDDAELWTVPQTRYVTGVRPDQEGRFQIRNLPAGGYYAIALDYVEQGAWGDPELLLRLKTNASSFSLREGETKTLDLKMSQ